MIPILDEIYPDFIGTANGKTITLDTYRRSVKIILGSEVFTPEEIKYLSNTLEYNDLVKIIIFICLCEIIIIIFSAKRKM